MPTVSVTSYKPVPANTYHLLVKACKIQKAQRDGSEFLSWELEITDDEEVGGKTFNFATSMQISRGSKAYPFVIACGIQDEGEDDFSFDTSDLIGQTFWGEVTEEENKGKRGGMRDNLVKFWTEDEFAAHMEKISKLKKPVAKAPVTKQPVAAGPKSPLRKPAAAEEEAEEDGEEAGEAVEEAPAPAPVKKSGPLHFPAK